MPPPSPAPEGVADLLGAARSELQRRIAVLTRQFDEVVASSVGSNADDEHDPEGATIAFERSQVESLVRSARRQLAEIDAAQDRLDAGVYGLCEACGLPRARGRLDARPFARTCIACAVGGGRHPQR